MSEIEFDKALLGKQYNPTQEQIKEWIAKAEAANAPNAITEFDVTDFTDRPLKYIQHFLLEMKVQIDRWDLVMENLYIHPHVEKMFIAYLGDAVDKATKPWQFPSIWGCQIIKTEHMPEDKMIGFNNLTQGNEDIDDGRNIALGKLDIRLLNKVNQMKAFW